MKLVAFRIQCYRSIIDTDWQNLSPDNLTTIVGQNESGKSAILTGLLAFYNPQMDDDSLRGDDSLPKISCRFKLSRKEMLELFGDNEVPRGFQAALTKSGWHIDITRTWNGLDNTVLSIDNEDLVTLLNDLDTEVQEELRIAMEARVKRAEPEEEPTETQTPEAIIPNPVLTEAAPVQAVPAPIVLDETSAAEEEEVEEDEEEPLPERNILTYQEFLTEAMKRIPEFVLFEDHASYLPATIDLSAIASNRPNTRGLVGTRNFLKLANLSVDDIIIKSHRRSGGKIRTASKNVTAEFHEFWEQIIGGGGAKAQIEVELKHYTNEEKGKAGKPYLVFWVKNGEELLHPHQRSGGLQWFLSFFLQIMAASLPNAKPQILLIDEPGQSLHIKAQADILKVFEKAKSNIQIVYTTHSPNLIKQDGLHRILAVQRADEGDSGETQVFAARKLARANRDTLLPIFSLIGADISTQTVIERTNNVILEEPSAFYYISAFKQLTDDKRPMNFLPATGASNVRIYVNLFLGWGIDFLVAVDDDQAGKDEITYIENHVYGGKTDESERHLMTFTGYDGIENVFTKGDFRRYVIEDTGASYATDNNSYMKAASLSKLLTAISFYVRAMDGTLKFTDFDITTQNNIKKLLDSVSNKLSEIEVFTGSKSVS